MILYLAIEQMIKESYIVILSLILYLVMDNENIVVYNP